MCEGIIQTFRDRYDRIVDLSLLFPRAVGIPGPCHRVLLVQMEHAVEVHPAIVRWVVAEVSAKAFVACRGGYTLVSSTEVGVVP